MKNISPITCPLLTLLRFLTLPTPIPTNGIVFLNRNINHSSSTTIQFHYSHLLLLSIVIIAIPFHIFHQTRKRKKKKKKTLLKNNLTFEVIGYLNLNWFGECFSLIWFVWLLDFLFFQLIYRKIDFPLFCDNWDCWNSYCLLII